MNKSTSSILNSKFCISSFFLYGICSHFLSVKISLVVYRQFVYFVEVTKTDAPFSVTIQYGGGCVSQVTDKDQWLSP